MKRAGWIILGAAGLAFAIQGGEYSTVDLIRQQRAKKQLVRDIDALNRAIDSLRQFRDRVERDPATQERLAREIFGMVRGEKELLYRFAPDNSVSRPSK
jgi:cell division protein FtsB